MPKKDLEQEVLFAARDNGVSSVLFRNAVGRKLGLSITDSECLSVLSIKGVSTPTELAHYTGLTSGSTTAMLDRLEKANFIRRKPNPDDRRGILIEITDEYRERVRPYVAGLQEAHAQLLKSYSGAELEVIADFLKRFTRNIVERTQDIAAGRA